MLDNRAVDPINFFHDLQGQALVGGYVYYGESGRDAEAYPITVYWDRALSVAAAQPLRTIAGRVDRDGSPSPVYVDGDYSIKVKDSAGVLIYSILSARDMSVIMFPDFDALDAYSGDLSADAIMVDMESGNRYKVVSSGGDFTTTGGISLVYRYRNYDTVALFLASVEPSRGVGSIWEAGGFRYKEESAPFASPHVTNAAGVRFTVLPNPDGTVSVRAFGAKFDGTTDDTTAIQAAINAAYNNLDTFNTVTFPAGQAVISDTLDWKPQVNLIGHGKPFGFVRNVTEIYLADNSNCNMIETSATTTNPAGESLFGFHAEMRGINWQGNSANQTAGDGIVLATSELTLVQCAVRDVKGVGCRISASGGTSIRDCHFTNNGQQNMIAGGADLVCLSCEFQNADIGNTSTYPNLLITGPHNRFGFCRFGMDNSTGTDGVQIATGGNFTKIDNCTIQNNTRHGIYISNGSKGTISNNTYVGNGGDCINFAGGTIFSIIGGIMDSTAGDNPIVVGSSSCANIFAVGHAEVGGNSTVVSGATFISIVPSDISLRTGRAVVTVLNGQTDRDLIIAPGVNTSNFAVVTSSVADGGSTTTRAHAIGFNSFKLRVTLATAASGNTDVSVNWVAVASVSGPAF